MKVLAPILFLLLASCGGRPRLKPFATDGCSLFPDGDWEHRRLWRKCCVKHDAAYWRGGAKAERLQADRELRACVTAVGRPKIAKLLLRGARAGGTPYLPTSFRWGYGWRYPRGYKRLSAEDARLVAEAERL